MGNGIAGEGDCTCRKSVDEGWWTMEDGRLVVKDER